MLAKSSSKGVPTVLLSVFAYYTVIIALLRRPYGLFVTKLRLNTRVFEASAGQGLEESSWARIRPTIKKTRHGQQRRRGRGQCEAG